jgi:hypothetical protein
LEASLKQLEGSLKQIDAVTTGNAFISSLDMAEKAAQGAPRGAFDVKAKAAELGGDVDRSFAFVRDDVRLQTYRGVLKGARGTLMARAGNSFDRALLLGALLREHGVQVRFAHGTLDPGQASLLVSRMFEAGAVAPAKKTRPDSSEVPPALKQALQTTAESLVERWVNNVHTIQDALRPKSKVWSEVARSVPDLASEVREHVWVEYRRGDEWIPLDPCAAAAGLKPGESLTKATGTWESIPASMHHKIVIAMVQEERNASGLTTREMLRHEARAEELDAAEAAFNFDIAQSGLGWSATPVLSLEGRNIRGRRSAGSGLDVSAADLGSRLFARPGAAPQRAGEVTAAWLEFRFSSPGGSSDTLRREIFDRIGPVARASHREAQAVLATLEEKSGIPLYVANQYAFSFSAGPIHPDLINSHLQPHFAALRSAQPIFTKIEAENRAATPGEVKQLAKLLGPAVPAQLGALARTFHALSWEGLKFIEDRRIWKHLMFYATSPRLAIVSIEPRVNEKGDLKATVSLDLRRNDLRPVGPAIDAANRAWANVVRGVFDAVLEDTVLRINMPASERTDLLSTVALVERITASGTGLTAMTTAEEIAALKAPDAVRARISGDGGHNRLLVTSPTAIRIGNNERLGWWRIEMPSGENLGVLDTGLHQSMTENATVIAVLTVAVVSVAYTFRPFSSRYFMSDLPEMLNTGKVPGREFNDMGSNGGPVR